MNWDWQKTISMMMIVIVIMILEMMMTTTRTVHHHQVAELVVLSDMIIDAQLETLAHHEKDGCLGIIALRKQRPNGIKIWNLIYSQYPAQEVAVQMMTMNVKELTRSVRLSCNVPKRSWLHLQANRILKH